FSRYDHHISRIVLLDRPAEGLDPFGTARAKRNEQHLILLQVDNVIQSAFQPHEVRGGLKWTPNTGPLGMLN
ncbi:MAG TPA: hypothetical protein VKK19_03330, partial [Candidatus Dormibacteraeota bacterium]|nr:hypothetical protein [Candidatus Dormibacteraeota bacterium]